jgi:calcyphosin
MDLPIPELVQQACKNLSKALVPEEAKNFIENTKTHWLETGSSLIGLSDDDWTRLDCPIGLKHEILAILNNKKPLLQRQRTVSSDSSSSTTAPIPASLIKLRNRLAARGASNLNGITRQFKLLDKDQSGTINKAEFERLLNLIDAQGINIEEIFDYFDEDHSDSINYEEFLKLIRPPINQRRLKAILEVFNLLDSDSSGFLTSQEVTDYWRSGALMADPKIAIELLRLCDKDGDGKISKTEFKEYYENLSRSIDHDDHFIHLVRNCWKVQGSDTKQAKTNYENVILNSRVVIGTSE